MAIEDKLESRNIFFPTFLVKMLALFISISIVETNNNKTLIKGDVG